ncbi:hypothetical protein KAR28_04445 [Candidatus Parcubacteria bacterium]|nr:hypothetical protein [Candidatus Parcubacteria bacterium]
MKKNEIKLGQKVKDNVSGLVGIAVARLDYLNGCCQLAVKPDKLDKEGSTIEAEYIDIQQLEVVGNGVIETKGTEPLGGACYKRSAGRGARI